MAALVNLNQENNTPSAELKVQGDTKKAKIIGGIAISRISALALIAISGIVAIGVIASYYMMSNRNYYSSQTNDKKSLYAGIFGSILAVSFGLASFKAISSVSVDVSSGSGDVGIKTASSEIPSASEVISAAVDASQPFIE